MKRSAFILLVFLFSWQARAQEPKISARTDSLQYKVGQWILLRIDAELPPGVDSLLLAAKDSLGAFEILNTESSRARDGRQQWNLRLTIFDTGSAYIPPVPLVYKTHADTLLHLAYTNPIPLTIVAIPFDPKGDIKDIKPPLDAPWRFEDFLPYLIVLLLIVLGFLAYWYYRKWKKRREEGFVPEEPAVPPGEAALAALRILEEKHLWQHGKVKEYYSEVTEIIRRFLEGQYRVSALESTSDEIMDQLKHLPEAQALISQFRSFFTTADLVKFAKYMPAPEEHEHELRWGYEFIRAMIPREVQQPEVQEVENVR